MVTTRLAAGCNPKSVDAVECITTPGDTIDVVVTEAGVAVNPQRTDLRERLETAGIPPVDIERLRKLAMDQTGGRAARRRVNPEARIVAVVEHRDSTVFDVVRLGSAEMADLPTRGCAIEQA